MMCRGVLRWKGLVLFEASSDSVLITSHRGGKLFLVSEPILSGSTLEIENVHSSRGLLNGDTLVLEGRLDS
jgi:hypothetical protein